MDFTLQIRVEFMIIGFKADTFRQLLILGLFLDFSLDFVLQICVDFIIIGFSSGHISQFYCLHLLLSPPQPPKNTHTPLAA